MDWRDHTMLLSVVVCWFLFFVGLDDVPGWQGFGRGLFVGSMPVLAILVVRQFQGRSKKRNPS